MWSRLSRLFFWRSRTGTFLPFSVHKGGNLGNLLISLYGSYRLRGTYSEILFRAHQSPKTTTQLHKAKARLTWQYEKRDGACMAYAQDQPAPMRIGFTGSLVDGFHDVEWFGRGPHESYLDRHSSARVGLFQGSIAEQTVARM